jgi:hypothetical protein
MVEAVLRSLNCEVADIGWELPLSKDGAGLVQKLTPSQWWGRGDVLSLHETLTALFST